MRCAGICKRERSPLSCTALFKLSSVKKEEQPINCSSFWVEIMDEEDRMQFAELILKLQEVL